MVNFVDEYQRQLDERGRIIMPARIREDLSETVYVTQSPLDRCLHLYTEEEWNVVAEEVRKLPTTIDPHAAAFARVFFGKATSVQMDKQGRIPLAKRLIDYAGITKDVVLIGANKRLEIWDAQIWNSYQDELSDGIMIEGIKQYGLSI